MCRGAALSNQKNLEDLSALNNKYLFISLPAFAMVFAGLAAHRNYPCQSNFSQDPAQTQDLV
jgi:hypothetical protein